MSSSRKNVKNLHFSQFGQKRPILNIFVVVAKMAKTVKIIKKCFWHLYKISEKSDERFLKKIFTDRRMQKRMHREMRLLKVSNNLGRETKNQKNKFLSRKKVSKCKIISLHWKNIENYPFFVQKNGLRGIKWIKIISEIF